MESFANLHTNPSNMVSFVLDLLLGKLRAILFCPEPLRTQQNWTDSGHQTLG